MDSDGEMILYEVRKQEYINELRSFLDDDFEKSFKIKD